MLAYIKKILATQIPPAPLKYTPRAKRVIDAAKQIGPSATVKDLTRELLSLPDGCAHEVLVRLGFTPQKLQDTIAHADARVSIEETLLIAHEEQKAMSHLYLGTEHLLLASIRVIPTFAAALNAQAAIDLECARHEVMRELDPNYRPSP